MGPACDCESTATHTSPSAVARLALLRAVGGALRWDRPGVVPARPAAPRILLIRPDHIGDVLLTTPSVELLRRALPGAHLTMMVGPWSEEVARRDPLLDEIAVCSFPGFARSHSGVPWEPYRLLLSVAEELSRRSYDAALLLRFDHWWGAWLSAAARIPVRIGFGTPESRPFLNYRLTGADGHHWVSRSLKVAERLLGIWGVHPTEVRPESGLRFQIRAGDTSAADDLLAEAGIRPSDRLVTIHPGSGAALKSWPASFWAGLGRRLSNGGLRIIVTGAPGEAEMAEKIAASIPGSRCLAGRTSLGTLAALFRRCALVAGVDSGPLHLAVAVDSPSLRLYGPTDVAVFGPWGDPARHLSITSSTPLSPCNRLDVNPRDGESPACMRAITVEQVESACRDLLALDERGAVSLDGQSPVHPPVPEVRS